MRTNKIPCDAPTAPESVGDAVGVEKNQWFIAIVKNNTEKSCSKKLDKIGIINYLPVQSETRIWKNGKKAKIERIVLPSMLFVYCSESERREIVLFPFINRFMTNRAGTKNGSGNNPLAIVPDEQIERLKFMLGQSDIPIEISSNQFNIGDRVRVIRGSLVGLEGNVVNMHSSKSEMIINLDFLGSALLQIETVNLEVIS